MTTNLTKDLRSDTRSDPANEPPVASKTQPWPAIAPASSELDLQSRIRVRRAELIAKLRELEADMRLGATEARDKLRATLSELTHVLKWGIVDGWASLGDKVKHRLEHWLDESRRHLPAQASPAQAGPAQAGPAQAGPAQAGPAQAGQS
jgi:hypothetical protein